MVFWDFTEECYSRIYLELYANGWNVNRMKSLPIYFNTPFGGNIFALKSDIRVDNNDNDKLWW